mmetsp:Transcript_40686/g.86172  ORF Transcript_40686/g.86172 Transcript_40686/m.86172 type:complete len:98 (-) Transcript_40686:261-554(-)
MIHNDGKQARGVILMPPSHEHPEHFCARGAALKFGGDDYHVYFTTSPMSVPLELLLGITSAHRLYTAPDDTMRRDFPLTQIASYVHLTSCVNIICCI